MADINDNNNIFSPAVYHGREDQAPYGELVKNMALPFIEQLVIDRAKEDGEWCINTGRVGKDNTGEPKMRRMMEFVSTKENIHQAVDYNLLERGGKDSVDHICRELANAAKWAAGAKRP